jgi:hypothetical protein
VAARAAAPAGDGRPGRRRRGVRAAAAAVAGVLLLAACSGQGEGDAVPTVDPGGTDPTTSAGPAPDPGTPLPVAWHPEQGTPWQWQLTGDLDLSVDVPVYDVDWERTDAATVDELHRRGRRAICYVSVGTYEPYRADADSFPDEVLGTPLEDWPDERWLDVRRLDLLGPLLLARFDVCRDKGFDAVEPDNVDGYLNDSGFPLTASDQLAFNRWVAAAVHARGMSVGLKNDLEQIPELVQDFDFAVNEQCLQYDECDTLRPFLDAGKAVLHVEYELTEEQLCAAEVPPGFSTMLKTYDLDAYRFVCP